MLPNNLIPRKLIMIDGKGNELEIEGSISIDNQIDNTILDDPYMTNVTQNSYSLTIEKIKPLTRKKYIKLLMSKGIGRNGANEIAKYTLKKRGKYDYLDLFYW